jgi:hypothetical protein
MIKGPKTHPYETGSRTPGHAHGGVNDYEWGWRSHRMNGQEFYSAVAVLVRQLARYDEARFRLENEGGSFSLLKKTMDILKEELLIPGRHETHKVALTDQRGLRLLLHREFWPYECRLEVRKRPTGMPVYYLARVWPDYRSEYSLVLEDLFRSTEYPLSDERFIKLMRSGHEVYFLRLSQFRKPMFKGSDSKKEHVAHEEVDELLLNAGRNVFQACWHEDQYVGMAAAGQFGLENFRRAIELLYLGLSAELCELRTAVTEDMLRFFSEIYVQPAILAFLEGLTHLDGKALAEVPQTALRLYPALSRAFSRFLAVELPWGPRRALTPLYKLLFANFSRLDAVGKVIVGKAELKQAAEVLEKQSQGVIQAILGGSDETGLGKKPSRDHLRVVKR